MAAEEIPRFFCETVTAKDSVPQQTLGQCQTQLLLDLGPQMQVVLSLVVGNWDGINILLKSDTLVDDTKIKIS